MPQHLAQRATIILLAADGQTNADIARTIKVNRNTVKEWRKRWAASAPTLDKTEADQPRALRVAIQREIVESISARQVGRYLAAADLKPHLSRYWLNPDVDDPKEFEANARRVCDLYAEAPQLAEAGVEVHCTDEMTGIKAHEQTHPPLPMEPGKPEGPEFEYKRHGTSGMIASRNIVTGQIEAPLIQPMRTEGDFAQHIRNVVALQPADKQIFVLDNLNTHQSETLVRFVIEHEGLKIPDAVLGEKGKSGILKNQASRKPFLKDVGHRVQFLYTPKDLFVARSN